MKTERSAQIAMVCTIFGYLLYPFFILALIFGHLTLWKSKNQSEHRGGNLAFNALFFSYLGLVIMFDPLSINVLMLSGKRVSSSLPSINSH